LLEEEREREREREREKDGYIMPELLKIRRSCRRAGISTFLKRKEKKKDIRNGKGRIKLETQRSLNASVYAFLLLIAVLTRSS